RRWSDRDPRRLLTRDHGGPSSLLRKRRRVWRCSAQLSPDPIRSAPATDSLELLAEGVNVQFRIHTGCNRDGSGSTAAKTACAVKKQLLIDFLCAAAGSPLHYVGREMKL